MTPFEYFEAVRKVSLAEQKLDCLVAEQATPSEIGAAGEQVRNSSDALNRLVEHATARERRIMSIKLSTVDDVRAIQSSFAEMQTMWSILQQTFKQKPHQPAGSPEWKRWYSQLNQFIADWSISVTSFQRDCENHIRTALSISSEIRSRAQRFQE